jgi:hypothetical protein
MRDAVHSEGIKLATARSSAVLAVIAAVVPLALGVLVAVSIPTNVSGVDDTIANRYSFATAGLGTSHVLLAVLGALLIGSEYRNNTIRVTLAAEPRRLRVHGAKIVVMAVVGVVIGVVATVSSFFAASAILGARGRGVSVSDPGVLRALIGAVVVAGLYALVGLGVGTIVRATAGAITFLVVWPVIVEALLTGFLPSVGKYFPFSAATAALSPDGAKNVLNPYAGGAIFLAFTLGVLIAGGALLSARDA